MSYINEYRFINNQKNQNQNNHIRNNSSEKVFKRTPFLNYDKIYNQFLTTPYPPMYYKRFNKNNESQNQYNNNTINKEIRKQDIYEDEDNNQFINPQNYNNLEILNKNRINNYKTKNNYLNNNLDFKEELREERRTPRNKILNPSLINSNINYHYNNNIITENGENNRHYQLTNDSYNRYNNAIKNTDSNENELFNKRRNNNNFNIINTDNNRLGFSYDNIKEIKKNERYVSPIIAQIAKKNYLGDNPYTEKDQNLGNSMLKSNPILYPIDTYKFDFNRYI